MTKKQRAELYRQAAKLMEDGAVEFSCHAIVKAQTGDLPREFFARDYPEVMTYGDAFRPPHVVRGATTPWFLNELCAGVVTEEVNAVRVLMLCFAAAMVETGDL